MERGSKMRVRHRLVGELKLALAVDKQKTFVEQNYHKFTNSDTYSGCLITKEPSWVT